jgi:hypothetical protein
MNESLAVFYRNAGDLGLERSQNLTRCIALREQILDLSSHPHAV